MHYVGLQSDQDESAYAWVGEECRRMILSALPDGWTFTGKRVLDFGCGAGRVIRHFEVEADEGEFVGCDIDEDSVTWASSHLDPPFAFFLNGEGPPLQQPAESFDLIYAMSVFTHLTDTWSTWLLELHRALRPDGLLIVSFLGPDAIEAAAGEPYSQDRVGMNAIDIGNPWQRGGPTAMHSPWWLRTHFGRAFQVVDVLPAHHPAEGLGHGFICLRKDSRPPPSAVQLEMPEPGEPRELSALRHNAAQLRREHRHLRINVLRRDGRRHLGRAPRHAVKLLRSLLPLRPPRDLDSLQAYLVSLKEQIIIARADLARP
jgi:SAM-dependent methyltransferase